MRGSARLHSVLALASITAGLGIAALGALSLHRRLTPLYDYSYALNVAHRILSGGVPYVDFDLTLTPGSFYVMAGALELFGQTSTAVLALTIFLAVASFALSVMISARLCSAGTGFSLSQLPLWVPVVAGLFSLTSTWAQPWYDSYAVLCIQLSILVFLWASPQSPWPRWLLFGLSVPLAFWFKQNIGAAYIAAVLVVGCLWFVRERRGPKSALQPGCLVATAAGVLGAILIPGSLFLVLNNSLGHFLKAVFLEAGASKGLLSVQQLEPYARSSILLVAIMSIGLVLAAWSGRRAFWLLALPWVGAAGVAAVAFTAQRVGEPESAQRALTQAYEPFAWIAVSSVILGTLLALHTRYAKAVAVQFLAGAALLGMFASQTFVGSSFAAGPLLMIALVCSWDILRKSSGRYVAMAAVIGAAGFGLWLTIGVGFSGSRLGFVGYSSSENYVALTQPDLSSITLEVEEARDFEALAYRLQDFEGSLVELPMEDPLPLVSPNHQPWSRCPSFHPLVCKSQDQTLEMLVHDPPDLLIIRKRMQMGHNPETIFDPVLARLAECGYGERIGDTYLLVTSAEVADCLGPKS